MRVGSRIPGVRLARRIQQVRDPAVDPHGAVVVAPDLQLVAPGVAGVLVEYPVEACTGADAIGRVARHTGPIDRGVLRRVAREVGQRARRHGVRDLGDLQVAVRHARPEEPIRRGEGVRPCHCDRCVELRHGRVAQLQCRGELQRRKIGVEVDDEAVVVVQREAAQRQRLRQHGHNLHHLRVRRVRDDQAVHADALENVSGRGQGRVVPVPQRLDLGPFRRGRVVLPLRARVMGTLERPGATGAAGSSGVPVPG